MKNTYAFTDNEWLYPASVVNRLKRGWVYKIAFDYRTNEVKAMPVYLASFLRIPIYWVWGKINNDILVLI
jgi:hypothetical protein